MLEKPKRIKQLNNQDRQIPANIQELINRYDLENIDIYKFLDYLVDSINKNKNEVVNNLESDSVRDSLSANQGRILNERIEGVVLFENASGDNNSDIILNDTLTKYKEIKIEYVMSLGSYTIKESKRIRIKNGDYITLSSIVAVSDTSQLLITGRYLCANASLTRVYSNRSSLGSTGVTGWNSNGGIYITKITGYY